MTITVRGHQGRVRVGYQTAAAITSFALTPLTPGSWTVEGSVGMVDLFWVSQGPPFTLELHIGKQRWTWRGAAVEVSGGLVRGTVTGRPERV
jgi:hypothetical protein